VEPVYHFGKTLHTFGFREQGRRTRARLKDRHPIPLLPQSIDKDAEIVGSWDFPHRRVKGTHTGTPPRRRTSAASPSVFLLSRSATVAPLNAAIVLPPNVAPAMLDLNLNREDRILQSPNHLS
jgi:hypothetical protein